MAQDASSQSGDPGRTPGAAEGDEETVEQDLEEKGLSGDDTGKAATKQQNSPMNNRTAQDKTNQRDKS